MITIKNQSDVIYFILETDNNSYIFETTKSGLLLHDYFGAKITIDNFESIKQKLDNGRGTAVLYENNKDEFIDSLDLETSFIGVGDYREHQISLVSQISGYTNNFKYLGYDILEKGSLGDKEFNPSSYEEDNILRLDLFDEVLNCKMEMYYKVFESSNIISKYIRIINKSENKYQLIRAFSNQIDFKDNDFIMMTFDGSWSNERQVKEQKLTSGIYINDSKCGSSSNKHNPFVILKKENTTEEFGKCYGFNLVYSGNHKTTVEVKSDNKVRLLQGINDFCFNYDLNPNEEFCTPEAIISFSKNGLNGLSQNMHDFINNHIVRGEWKKKERPTLINNWEATYFNFDEAKLLNLARASKSKGIELFVLDDGWFGNRNDDTSSLGDYYINKKKLPLGLKHLCDKINKLGMMFGLWVEPEMISENSSLYKLHPDWAVKVEGRKPSIGRNQMLLDLTNPDVRKYLIDSLSEVFSSCNLSYVKWDYNRSMSDMYSKTLKNQGEFFHRYITGLYEVFKEITSRFPHILFEGCASGGARFDLGILCFFPQIWTSDDTDYLERIYIQTGTSYGYPLSTMGCHVSDVPNHQTLRNTSINSRYNISIFGVLGYELNIPNLTRLEKNEIKTQVQLYKKHRYTLQYGKFYRSNKTIYNNNNTYFWCVNESTNEVVLGFFQSLVHPNQKEDVIYMYGLKDGNYSFETNVERLNLKNFGGLINMVSPIKLRLNGPLHNFICKVYKLNSENDSQIVSSSTLREAGIRLKGQFLGTGFNNNVRVLGDFGSRVYLLKLIK